MSNITMQGEHWVGNQIESLLIFMKPGQDCLNTQRSQKSLRLRVLILLTAWKLLGVEVVSVLMAEAQHVSWGHQSWWSRFALAHGWKILLLEEGGETGQGLMR